MSKSIRLFGHSDGTTKICLVCFELYGYPLCFSASDFVFLSNHCFHLNFGALSPDTTPPGHFILQHWYRSRIFVVLGEALDSSVLRGFFDLEPKIPHQTPPRRQITALSALKFWFLALPGRCIRNECEQQNGSVLCLPELQGSSSRKPATRLPRLWWAHGGRRRKDDGQVSSFFNHR